MWFPASVPRDAIFGVNLVVIPLELDRFRRFPTREARCRTLWSVHSLGNRPRPPVRYRRRSHRTRLHSQRSRVRKGCRGSGREGILAGSTEWSAEASRSAALQTAARRLAVGRSGGSLVVQELVVAMRREHRSSPGRQRQCRNRGTHAGTDCVLGCNTLWWRTSKQPKPTESVYSSSSFSPRFLSEEATRARVVGGGLVCLFAGRAMVATTLHQRAGRRQSLDLTQVRKTVGV